MSLEEILTNKARRRWRSNVVWYAMQSPKTSARALYGDLPRIGDQCYGVLGDGHRRVFKYVGTIETISADYKVIVTSFDVRFVRVIGHTWKAVNAEKNVYLMQKYN